MNYEAVKTALRANQQVYVILKNGDRLRLLALGYWQHFCMGGLVNVSDILRYEI
jgi:hypothetical protein